MRICTDLYMLGTVVLSLVVGQYHGEELGWILFGGLTLMLSLLPHTESVFDD